MNVTLNGRYWSISLELPDDAEQSAVDAAAIESMKLGTTPTQEEFSARVAELSKIED
jgi:hypothetical protein